MLVTLKDILPKARQSGYAVGLFDTLNLEMVRGVVAAAEAAGSPAIIGGPECFDDFAPLEELAWCCLPAARRAGVPIVVMLDHGTSEACCKRCLEWGYSSIMYDCSTLPYEENVKAVAEMAYAAHQCGASIEAELGHVGQAADDGDPSCFYTDPEQARDFVERTGVDALAIAVGTAHGAYRSAPKLDFARITAIAEAIPETALVLHGGSGLSDADFRKAIELGISKINIFTDINIAAARAAHVATENPAAGLGDTLATQTAAIKEATLQKMRIFGTAQ